MQVYFALQKELLLASILEFDTLFYLSTHLVWAKSPLLNLLWQPHNLAVSPLEVIFGVLYVVMKRDALDWVFHHPDPI